MPSGAVRALPGSRRLCVPGRACALSGPQWLPLQSPGGLSSPCNSRPISALLAPIPSPSQTCQRGWGGGEKTPQHRLWGVIYHWAHLSPGWKQLYKVTIRSAEIYDTE